MLKRIRLELARTHEYPNGNSGCGYEFTAPIDRSGHLDADAWAKIRQDCRVRRFWTDAQDERGWLVCPKDRHWAFSYAPGEDDDEPIFKLDRHLMRVGEYVTITEHDGVARPFRVVEVVTASLGGS
jgi:hypothetical protein